MKPAVTQKTMFAIAAGPRLRCFLGWQPFWLLTIICCQFVLPILGFGQVVEVPCKGSVSECAHRHEEVCKKGENTAANLIVPKKTKVWGLLIDPSGVPFEHTRNGLTIQLGDPKTSQVIASSQVSEMGTFELGEVVPGKYRLIAVLIVDGKTTRFHGWAQPNSLACGDSDECTLAMLLRPSGTDNPIDFCPPK